MRRWGRSFVPPPRQIVPIGRRAGRRTSGPRPGRSCTTSNTPMAKPARKDRAWLYVTPALRDRMKVAGLPQAVANLKVADQEQLPLLADV